MREQPSVTIMPQPATEDDQSVTIAKLIHELKDDPRLKAIVVQDDGSKAVVLVPVRDRAAIEAKEPRAIGVDFVFITSHQARELGIL